MRLRSISICTFAVLGLIPVLPLHGQPPASHEKGLSSNTAYQTGDIDHINLFNGNLVLRVPIGSQAGKVSRVDVAAFGGQTATYTLQYTPQQLRRQNYEPATCSTGPDEGLNVTVDVLSRLVLPDGSYDLVLFPQWADRGLGWRTLRVLSPGCFRCSAFSARRQVAEDSAESAAFQQPGLRAKRGTPGQMPDLSPGTIKTSTRHHVYNALGWKLSETSWDSNQKTFFENHDRFGRVGTIRPPGANPATDFTYQGERTTTRRSWIQTSVNGTRTSSYSTEMQDTFGRLIGVCENRSSPWSGHCAGGQETYYAYDEGERLTTVCQNWTGSSCGQQRLFTYDNRGFLLSERHPEVGPFGNGWTHYAYDALGNRRTKGIPGASGFDLAYRYDRAGRLVGIDEALTPSSSRPLKEFYFARSNSGTNRKAGKLVLAKRYNYVDLLPPLPPRSTSGSIPIVISDAYEYKGRDGRTSKHQLRYQLGVTSYLFNTSYTWDEQGNVDRLTYPECLHDVCSGRAPPRVIDHDYERSFLRRVGSYADAIAYQAGGMLRRVPHGNGVSDWIDLASDGLSRPYRMRTTGVANGNWDTGFYVYDGAQNVSNIGPLSFSYDLLSRLTAGDADAGGAIKRETVSYDAYGNIQQINSGGAVQHPSPNPATNRLAIASYDGAGNVVGTTLGNVDYAYDYDPLNMMKHLRTSNDVSRIFVYNANDERVLAFDCAVNVCVNGTAVETWSLRGVGGRVLRELSHPWDGGWSWTRDAIYRDGQLLAYEEPAGVRHLHLDHLGTPRQITDQNGNEVAYHAYYPFGEEATDPQQDEFSLKFTGHERDENGGGVGRLDYMMARYCSPSLGRFLSVDPVLGQAGVPQSWNRYAYTRGNPLKFVDPDGEAVLLATAVLGAIEGAGFQVAINLISDQPAFKNVGREAALGAALGATGVGVANVGRKGLQALKAARLKKAVQAGSSVSDSPGAVSASLSRGTGQAARQLPFAEGEVIYRELKTSQGLLDVAAEVRIRGGTLHLKDIAVYPQGAESFALGPREILALRNQLAREAAELGFDQLRITGTRLTGANPGKQSGLIIDLEKFR